MYLNDLFEANRVANNVVVVYGGRFHLFTKGHKAVYDHLVDQFGADKVFITTSNKITPPKSPFSFAEKRKMMMAVGIPSKHIIEEPSPYQPANLLRHFASDDTAVIFAVGEKDMDQQPRFQPGYKKNGEPTYYQNMVNRNEMVSYTEHGYLYIVPNIEEDGRVISATDARDKFKAAFKDQNVREVHSLMMNVFGTDSKQLESILRAKLTESAKKRKLKTGKAGQWTVGKKAPTRGLLVGDKYGTVEEQANDDPLRGFPAINKKKRESHVVPNGYHSLLKNVEELVQKFVKTHGKMTQSQYNSVKWMIASLRQKLQDQRNGA